MKSNRNARILGSDTVLDTAHPDKPSTVLKDAIALVKVPMEKRTFGRPFYMSAIGA